MKTILCLAILAILVAPAIASAEPTNAITNIAPAPTQNSVTTFQVGSHIILPDGQKTYIETILPNGYFITANGLTVSAKGIVLEGPDTGEPITIDPDVLVTGSNVNNSSSYTNNSSYTLNRSVEIPGTVNRQVISPDVSNNSVSNRTSVNSNTRISTAPNPSAMLPVTSNNVSRKNVVSKTENVQIVQPQTTVRQVIPGSTVVVTESGSTQSPLTLAQLLPLTDIRTGKNLNVEEQAKTAAGKAQENPAKMAKNQGANTQQKPEQPTAGQGGKKQEQGKSVGPGQPLRIPPEAIASGNTDFMKGCWEGTRPEYATKRTIKECFCFNDDGKIGKRRIYDNNRVCIGSAKADLSQNGVLSVTSGGGVCDDGATWSAAEMVCQNSGQKTPCSWIFTDINNARQSYQIPFVRVESCGR